MTLLPVLLVKPATGEVVGYCNVTPQHLKARMNAYHRGQAKTIFALIHPHEPVPLHGTHVELISCLLVVPLEHLNKDQ